MARELRYYERILVAAADIQGSAPPSGFPEHPESELASIPALLDGTPATRNQLTEALGECERRGWMRLMKVFGPWSWAITASGIEEADRLRLEAESAASGVIQGIRQPTAAQAPPPRIVSPPLDPTQALLQAVFDAFVANSAWPTFQYLEKQLRQSMDAAQVLQTMPAGLVRYDRGLNPETLVKLTPSGVARCRGSDPVTAALVWLLRWVARKESEFVPESATQVSYPTLSSADANRDFLDEVPGGRTEDLYLAFLLVEQIPGAWGGFGGNQSGWTITPTREVQRFVGLTDIGELAVHAGVMPQVSASITAADVAYRGVLSGFADDSSRGADSLGVESEALAIADLITDRQVRPPLCIGVFGAWGAGKSFFMRLISDRVIELSRTTSPNFCANVIQVRFNAWHYIESSLWASLATTVFATLADAVEEMGGDRQALRKELFQKLDSAKAGLESAECRLVIAKAATEQAQRTLEESQVKATSAQQALVALTIQTVSAEDPAAKPDVEVIEKGIGRSASRITLGQVEALAEGEKSFAKLIKGIVGLPLRSQGRILAQLAWPVVLGVVLLIGLALIYRAIGAVLGGTLSLVGILLALRLLLHFQQAIAPAASRLFEREQSRSGAKAALDAEAAARSELDAAAALVAAAEFQLAAIDEAEKDSPYRFVLDRYAADDYTKQLGLAAIVQRDFEKLVTLLEKPLVAASNRRLERIVLYIDDLDRCPPTVVLEVLQAVHLLLAFRLFVVVLGVDVGWLYRAIGIANEIATGDVPHRYVEKIIQVPFWIRPMDAPGFTALIASLAPLARPVETTLDPPVGSDAESPRIAAEDESPSRSDADVRIRSLVLTPPEVNAMSRLSAFIPTPRAAKRLVNVYRLLKCMTGPEATSHLETGGHFTVLLQLALLCGMPEEALVIFDELQRSQRDSLWDSLDDIKASAAYRQAGPEGLQLKQALDAMIALRSGGEATAASWKYWAPLSTRFAFLRPNDR